MRHLGLSLLLVACAHNVPQDQATGPDGRVKGATPIALQETQGIAHGIVTYPGGDRVDWKAIELPEKQHGKLDLELTWRTPRPGLHVAFDVFDQWNTPIVTKAAHHRGGHMQMTTIDNAHGKYFVRVYAPKRGDAGEYKLVANFVPDIPPPPLDPSAVADPPRLPAVPPPEPECDPFDVKVKACEKVCPEVGAPQNWIGCRDRDKADQDKAACEQAKKDLAEHQKTAAKPFTSRMNHLEVKGDYVEIILPAGTTANPALTRDWKAEVLGAQTNQPLAGGSVSIIRVGTTQTLAKVHLTIDRESSGPADSPGR